MTAPCSAEMHFWNVSSCSNGEQGRIRLAEFAHLGPPPRLQVNESKQLARRLFLRATLVQELERVYVMSTMGLLPCAPPPDMFLLGSLATALVLTTRAVVVAILRVQRSQERGAARALSCSRSRRLGKWTSSDKRTTTDGF